MRLFLLTCVFIFTSLVFAQEDNYMFKVKVGDQAPNFTMTLSSGETVQLSDLKGKVVMLQFTASWCGVCIKEMPHIERDIWLKHKNNPKFALLGIDRDEPVETVLKFKEKTEVTYPIGVDPEGKIFQLYAEERAGITRNVIINPEGKIVMLTRLYKPEEFNKMVKLINSLLDESNN